PRSRLVRRRASGACQDTRHFRRHCAITFSTLSACLAFTLRVEAQPGRTAEVRDPYARGCGRGGAVRRPPIPIAGFVQNLIELLAIVDGSVGLGITANDLVVAVDADVVLVAIEALVVLLGPARVLILLRILGRLFSPPLRRLARFD